MQFISVMFLRRVCLIACRWLHASRKVYLAVLPGLVCTHQFWLPWVVSITTKVAMSLRSVQTLSLAMFDVHISIVFPWFAIRVPCRIICPGDCLSASEQPHVGVYWVSECESSLNCSTSNQGVWSFLNLNTNLRSWVFILQIGGIRWGQNNYHEAQPLWVDYIEEVLGVNITRKQRKNLHRKWEGRMVDHLEPLRNRESNLFATTYNDLQLEFLTWVRCYYES